MNIFVTSSPYLDGADRAILNPENHFVENLREVLPPFPRVLFVASDPERHDLTCSFGMDTAVAFCQAGIPFSAFQVLDGTNADRAAELVYSSDFLVLAGVPVLITRYGLQLAQKHLPANYFIYIFFNAFFTGGVSMFCTGLSGVSTLALAGAYPVDYLFGDALAFYFLLSWSEAFTTGLLIAIVVVYKPHWIITFDDRRYLYDKKDGGV